MFAVGSLVDVWLEAFLKRYEKIGAQFADACLVYLAERDGIDTTFTLNRRNFSVYRYGQNRRVKVILPRNTKTIGRAPYYTVIVCSVRPPCGQLVGSERAKGVAPPCSFHLSGSGTRGDHLAAAALARSLTNRTSRGNAGSGIPPWS